LFPENYIVAMISPIISGY